MKRTIAIITLCLVSFLSMGQSMYDAIAYGENNYYGTARSMSLGNAMTALGGDLGSVTLNPAGSAVANYSQFTVTPGVSVSSTASAYSEVFGQTQYGGENKAGKARFVLPNVGMNIRFYLPDGYFKTMTFSFLCNSTQQHLFFNEAAGINGTTTISGAYATSASFNADGAGHMLDPGVFKTYGDEGAFLKSNYGWNELCAYKGNMISYDPVGNRYLGVAEDPSEKPAGDLRQVSQRQRTGTKNDLIANFSFNHDDRFYLGLSLGIPFQRYAYSEIFQETPVDKSLFPVSFNTQEGTVNTCFSGSRYEYAYSARIDGIYGKFGFIYLPVKNLRVGASIQTPTAMTISESYRTSISSTFDDSRFSSAGTSPMGEFRYRMTSPYRASFGAAVTFGTAGLLSVDYELTDFSIMRYKEIGYDGSLLTGTFGVVNDIMKKFCGVSHQVRVGAEFNLLPCFAIRLGYNLKTSPERHYRNNLGNIVYASDYELDYNRYVAKELTLSDKSYDFAQAVHSAAIGLGYASTGSFFVDAVFRLNKYPDSSFAPYAQYYATIDSPNVRVRSILYDAAVTFGWRF